MIELPPEEQIKIVIEEAKKRGIKASDAVMFYVLEVVINNVFLSMIKTVGPDEVLGFIEDVSSRFGIWYDRERVLRAAVRFSKYIEKVKKEGEK